MTRAKSKNSTVLTVRFDEREFAELVAYYTEALGPEFPATRGEFIQLLISTIHEALASKGSLGTRFPSYGAAHEYLDSVRFGSDDQRARNMVSRRMAEEVVGEINHVPMSRIVDSVTREPDETDVLFDNLMGGTEKEMPR